MQAILNHLLQLSSSGFEVLIQASTNITVVWVWFSYFNTSEESFASKTTSLDYTASHPRDDLFGAQT